ncbi:unnamed protein product [Paramecium sonneborni]|uniref:Uncharacterized protein n=1 Tax=Paramecium sonneborni TaxID=65129 RepID=A0A8S1PI50_9CILI|nr:unnamed protein product [Paramecium sonneborni]
MRVFLLIQLFQEMQYRVVCNFRKLITFMVIRTIIQIQRQEQKHRFLLKIFMNWMPLYFQVLEMMGNQRSFNQQLNNYYQEEHFLEIQNGLLVQLFIQDRILKL